MIDWLAAGYAGLLLLIAAGLEWTARRVHRRTDAIATAGFTYEAGHDRWRCPTGNWLHRRHADHHRARVVYRAPAAACQACALKPQCTDSDQGRSLVIEPGVWVGSTMARFHRGLSLALLLLADLILVLAYARHPNWPSLAAVAGLTAGGGRLAQRFFQHGEDA